MSKFDISEFRNVTVALNTPFKEDEILDTQATKRLVRYLINKGVKALYVCGSTGEGFLLNEEERKKVVEAVIEEAKGEIKVIVHVGHASTKYACELAKHAYEVGADATSAVPSVYYRYSEESVYAHWTSITQAADLPFFIYNIPQLTGFNLSMPLFDRMLQNDRVAGVKCSSDPAQDILRFKAAGGDDFIVFNGPDEQYLAGRVLGADAGIGGTYAAMPELYLKLEDYIRKGNIEQAQKLQYRITALIYRLISFPSMYGAVKAILKLDGCDVGRPRMPFLQVSHEDPALIQLYNDIKQTIEEFK